MNFLINFRTLKCLESLTDIKPIILYHFVALIGGRCAQWLISSVSLSSFWQGAFASIGIYRPTVHLEYCVFSLLADHIDRWLLGGLRAHWILYSVSLSSFWQGAFASIDICRLLTGLFGYCVFSLLADYIDWWLPKSFAEKWSYETYLACNCEHISRGATRYCEDLSLHFLHWK